MKNLSEGKKIISNSPAFNGGNTIVKKVAPKQPVIGNIKTITIPKVVASTEKAEPTKEQSEESKMDVTADSGTPKSSDSNVSKESSWNLPPIDLKALKLPQQYSGVQNSKNKKAELNVSSLKNKTVSKSVKQELATSQSTGDKTSAKAKPKFTLSGSPSDSSQSGSQSPVSEMMNPVATPPVNPQADYLSTRPSDIDLHEMKLTSNPNSTNDLSQITPMASQGQVPGNQSMPFTSNTSRNKNQLNSNQNIGFQQPMQPTQKSSRSSSGIFNPGLPIASSAAEIKQTPGTVAQSQAPFQEQMFSNNQARSGLYGDSGGSGFMNMQSDNRNMASNFGQNFQNQNPAFGNQSSGFGTQNAGFGNTAPQQSSDTMADFTMSGIHNNSSFLSELTDADDNFLSQLDAYSDQNSQSSVDSTQTINQSGRMMQNTGIGQQPTGSQSGNMGMQNYQQGNMNFDMFSNQQQQNQNFFPNFSGNNQFNRSNSFGNQQNVNMSQQGGFPGGSMYPMGGMMQPGMFPYPAFPAYPYPPMMHPMPYYPMPFQPQYGGQGGSMGHQTGNVGQQGSNMGQQGSNMGIPLGQQGDNSFQSGMGGQ